MKKYLELFKNGFDSTVEEKTKVENWPYVGYSPDEDVVVYTVIPEKPGDPMVDLGLSVKWATMNVGASNTEEYGDYFAWGETEPKEVYGTSTYKWYSSSGNLTKYNTASHYGIVDNKTQLELSDDAAHVNLGGDWRMPTDAEWAELREQCTWMWTTQNGVNGYTVTGPNGKSIFLPAAGYRSGNSLREVGEVDRYWSSSLAIPYTTYALGSSVKSGLSGFYRSEGVPVRPVRPYNK